MSKELDPGLVVEMKALRHQEAMNAVIDQFDSPIQQFYRDSTVLVTGGTGFLGKQLVEKLFRSCQIKKIFLLLRPKPKQTIHQRLDRMLSDPVYDSLHMKQPNFIKKLEAVEGDIAELGLGLDETDRIYVTEQVDVIFHLAATTRFAVPIRTAIFNNARATREVINLAKDCGKLRSLVYVSTAYSQATISRIDQELAEKFYTCPVAPEVMIQLAETVDEDRLNEITPSLIKDWPNTYTFTKAIAEEIVRTESGNLPICVVRPPIVVGSYCEPSPGWLDISCVFGTSSFLAGISSGALHMVDLENTERDCINFTPVDIVNNTIIAAGWEAAQAPRHAKREILLYNVTNSKYAVRWRQATNISVATCRKIGSPKSVWYYFVMGTNYKLTYWIFSWLVHFIPAYMLDGVCALVGRRPMGINSFVKLYEKIENMTYLFRYFLCNKFHFKNDNVMAMMERMSEADKHIYNCDIGGINFEEYMQIWVMGIRKYIFKDGLKGNAEAMKRQRVFRVLTYLIGFLYLYILWCIIQKFWQIAAYVLG